MRNAIAPLNPQSLPTGLPAAGGQAGAIINPKSAIASPHSLIFLFVA